MSGLVTFSYLEFYIFLVHTYTHSGFLFLVVYLWFDKEFEESYVIFHVSMVVRLGRDNEQCMVGWGRKGYSPRA